MSAKDFFKEVFDDTNSLKLNHLQDKLKAKEKTNFLQNILKSWGDSFVIEHLNFFKEENKQIVFDVENTFVDKDLINSEFLRDYHAKIIQNGFVYVNNNEKDNTSNTFFSKFNTTALNLNILNHLVNVDLKLLINIANEFFSIDIIKILRAKINFAVEDNMQKFIETFTIIQTLYQFSKGNVECIQNDIFFVKPSKIITYYKEYCKITNIEQSEYVPYDFYYFFFKNNPPPPFINYNINKNVSLVKINSSEEEKKILKKYDKISSFYKDLWKRKVMNIDEIDRELIFAAMCISQFNDLNFFKDNLYEYSKKIFSSNYLFSVNDDILYNKILTTYYYNAREGGKSIKNFTFKINFTFQKSLFYNIFQKNENKFGNRETISIPVSVQGAKYFNATRLEIKDNCVLKGTIAIKNHPNNYESYMMENSHGLYFDFFYPATKIKNPPKLIIVFLNRIKGQLHRSFYTQINMFYKDSGKQVNNFGVVNLNDLYFVNDQFVENDNIRLIKNKKLHIFSENLVYDHIIKGTTINKEKLKEIVTEILNQIEDVKNMKFIQDSKTKINLVEKAIDFLRDTFL